MYTPASFNEPDRDKAFDAIERFSFGLLVSTHDGEPLASHLPLLLDRKAGANGSLIGHMARANPQWQQADGQRVLAVFQGPHAYISPTWYEAGNVVPTWNYVAVHAYGTFRAVHEPDALLEILDDYVRHYESPMPEPWRFDAGSEYNRKLAGAIVGFRIEITQLEAKWKLNQNQPRERREKVIAALEASGEQDDRDIAALMREGLKPAQG
jgi:transcriptional regulator